MTTHFVWIAGPRGPMPTRCDDESIITLRKYSRVLVEHELSNDMDRLSLDALALQFPAPDGQSEMPAPPSNDGG